MSESHSIGASGDKQLPKNAKEITGQRFGSLVAICRDGVLKDGRAVWLFACDCGNKKVIAAANAKRTKHCGCQYKNGNASHRMVKRTEYGIWVGMRSRCRSKNNSCWSRYGGRGISVCQRWDESFEAFFADMGPRPSKGHTLDRIDNDGDYCPENCRWATWAQQASNRRNNVLLEMDGKRQSIAAWASETGLSCRAIQSRIERGWSVKRALLTPLYPARRFGRLDKIFQHKGC